MIYLTLNNLVTQYIIINTLNIILCSELLLKTRITILVLTALVLLYLSSSHIPDLYVMAFNASSTSSLQHKATAEVGIQICCSWGEQIADGILTYRITGGDSNSQVVNAIHQAIDEWNSRVPNIKLQEITDSNTPADIDIKTNSKAQQVAHATISTTGGGHAIAARKGIKLVAPGEAAISFDGRGLITHVDMTISTKALGNSISSSELESIAKHEIGHAYGIGHTDFISDLMSPILTGGTNTDISQCDINGVEEANQWKLNAENSNTDCLPPAVTG
jgi:predicted Zn-dependent protease